MDVETVITFLRKAGFKANYAMGYVEVIEGTRTIATIQVVQGRIPAFDMRLKEIQKKAALLRMEAEAA